MVKPIGAANRLAGKHFDAFMVQSVWFCPVPVFFVHLWLVSESLFAEHAIFQIGVA